MKQKFKNESAGFLIAARFWGNASSLRLHVIRIGESSSDGCGPVSLA
jgi:hypothetical protein